MGATGYIIKGQNGGSGEAQKQVEVTPADGTIDVERVESEDIINFRIKTTYDGYETISAGSPYNGGYYKVIHIKFNEENRRYRLVCILNGGSYTPVAQDFAFYYIKFGWRTGGANADHWYIEEFSRQGNGAFVSLEQIALNEYNVLIHTPASYAYANIGILKEDKEPDVEIEHYDPQTTRYTPTGTIITTETPSWKNGSPAVWSVIPDVQTPVAGQLGHYYPGDRNLYFYDGYNWHNVYALAQGVASMLATTDRPATANEGTIYYDTTEQNLKIFYGGEWRTIVNSRTLQKVFSGDETDGIEHDGMLRTASPNMGGQLQLYYIYDGSQWQPALQIANKVVSAAVLYEDSEPITGQIRFAGANPSGTVQIYANGWKNLASTVASAINTSSTLSSGSNGSVRAYIPDGKIYYYFNGYWWEVLSRKQGETENQVVTFTNNSGETIVAEDKKQIIVTASFGSVSILDFSSVTKEEGKTIEINILSAAIIRVKDGATEIDLTGCNESIVKAICLSNVWHYYKTSSITEII